MLTTTTTITTQHNYHNLCTAFCCAQNLTRTQKHNRYGDKKLSIYCIMSSFTVFTVFTIHRINSFPFSQFQHGFFIFVVCTIHYSPSTFVESLFRSYTKLPKFHPSTWKMFIELIDANRIIVIIIFIPHFSIFLFSIQSNMEMGEIYLNINFEYNTVIINSNFLKLIPGSFVVNSQFMHV